MLLPVFCLAWALFRGSQRLLHAATQAWRVNMWRLSALIPLSLVETRDKRLLTGLSPVCCRPAPSTLALVTYLSPTRGECSWRDLLVRLVADLWRDLLVRLVADLWSVGPPGSRFVVRPVGPPGSRFVVRPVGPPSWQQILLHGHIQSM